MNTQDRMREPGSRTAWGYLEEGTAATELAGLQQAGSIPDAGQAREPSALPSPSRLMDDACALRRTAALRAAVRLDVFTAIGQGHDTPAALAQHCGAAERGMRTLCGFLVVLGLLEVRQGRYRAAPRCCPLSRPNGAACPAPMSGSSSAGSELSAQGLTTG